MDVTENQYAAGWSDDPWLFVSSLYASWRLSVATAAIVMVVTFLITTFLMMKTYRAFAILRPRTETSMQGQLVGSIAAAAIPSLSGLMPSPNQDVAEEYMTLLKSFAFNTALVEQHKLTFEPSHEWYLPGAETKDPKWQTYRRLQHSFMCDYSAKTGNITLYFEDRNRARAATILSYYIDDLRIKLRSQKTHETTAAIDSIRSAAIATPDSLLRVNLYELLARQVEQLQLAQVQADFAFAVLEPATAPDLAYRPKVAFDTIAAGLLALFACSAGLMTRDLGLRRRIQRTGDESITGHASRVA